ncbi:hypothetical protein ABZZ16_42285, partial [Streptomyces sp. NPDC006386]|uniref:hypothetical protein n=1 Tax=Streptomyces sp. NPDC006386 TaxID=3156762 RepID=UPI0033A13EA1
MSNTSLADQNLAQLANWLMYSVIAVYLLAFSLPTRSGRSEAAARECGTPPPLRRYNRLRSCPRATGQGARPWAVQQEAARKCWH